jgi:hypothetical protein
MKTLNYEGLDFTVSDRKSRYADHTVSAGLYSLDDNAIIHRLVSLGHVPSNTDKRWKESTPYLVCIHRWDTSAPVTSNRAYVKDGQWYTALDSVPISGRVEPIRLSPIEYKHNATLVSGHEIALVTTERCSVWLEHSPCKVYWHAYTTLEDALNHESKLMSWVHDSRYDNFEEEVVERWLIYGDEKLSPSEALAIIEAYDSKANDPAYTKAIATLKEAINV